MASKQQLSLSLSLTLNTSTLKPSHERVRYNRIIGYNSTIERKHSHPELCLRTMLQLEKIYSAEDKMRSVRLVVCEIIQMLGKRL